MAFALPLAIGAALVGSGVKAYGDYEGDQAASQAAYYRARWANQLATAFDVRGQQMRAAAGLRAQDVGLRYGAQVARERVFGAAGNVAGPSLQNVIGSSLALGQLAQRQTIATGESQASEEFMRAAEQRATGGLETAAGQQYAAAAPIAAAGDVLSGIGSAAGMAAAPGAFTPSAGGTGAGPPVNPKWYPGGSSWDYS